MINMKMPRFGQIVSVVSGLWFITMGVGVISDVIKGLRK